MVLPCRVDLVICVFDLVANDRGRLPCRIESERLFGINRADQEVIEEVPLAVLGRFWFSMGDYKMLAGCFR